MTNVLNVRWAVDPNPDLPAAVICDDETGYGVAEIDIPGDRALAVRVAAHIAALHNASLLQKQAAAAVRAIGAAIARDMAADGVQP